MKLKLNNEKFTELNKYILNTNNIFFPQNKI